MGDRHVPFLGYLTYGQMRTVVDHLPVHVGSANLPKGMQGAYEEATQTIVIDRNLIYAQKRCTLVHELIHWKYGDCQCDSFNMKRAERRARKETALMLVDLVDYATAESIYDGDVYCIACELGVTVQCVRDYQRYLKEQEETYLEKINA